MEQVFYAHTNQGDRDQWQLLHDHLENVAELAAGFTDNPAVSKIAYTAGLLHDLGKYSQAYQNRLLNNAKKVDHATAGAQEIRKLWKNPPDKFLATIIAFCVAGHHTGLPDYGSISDFASEPTLYARLQRELENYEVFKNEIKLENLPKLSFPRFKHTTKSGQFTLSFLTRMVYSMLVDADFQDTENFMNGVPKPRGGYPTMAELLKNLENYMKQFENAEESEINQLRNQILAAAMTKAEERQGFFTLTVPTGGGKTLTSLNFALRHAVTHHLNRIIYVVPYTTIIEQNAKVIKEALGDANVLEHHSNFDWEGLKSKDNFAELSDDADSSIEKRLKLAAENWDIPVVITTNVQFFESLFAHKSSRVRKLHNIANSVVIFDEAQNLPMEFLRPSLLAVTELVWNYGVSAVFCTATQPELKQHLPETVELQEIIHDPEVLYNKFRRVEVVNLGQQTDAQIAAHLQDEEQALCIVNTRRHALGLYSLLNAPGTYHLSTLMYPKHRQSVIEDIRYALDNGLPCRVISTQLLEAGVDLDFPVGFRAMAGLDSIIQAGGRVNRNNRLNFAELFVFEPVTDFIKKNPGFVQQSSDVTKIVFREWREKDPISPDAIRFYYGNLYNIQSKQAFDNKRIINFFEKQNAKDLEFDFRQASEEYSIIGDSTISVIVPCEAAVDLLKQLEWTPFPRTVARKLQAFSVAVYRHEFNQLYQEGRIILKQDRYPILLDPIEDYNEHTGLKLNTISSGEGIFLDS